MLEFKIISLYICSNTNVNPHITMQKGIRVLILSTIKIVFI